MWLQVIRWGSSNFLHCDEDLKGDGEGRVFVVGEEGYTVTCGQAEPLKLSSLPLDPNLRCTNSTHSGSLLRTLSVVPFANFHQYRSPFHPQSSVRHQTRRSTDGRRESI